MIPFYAPSIDESDIEAIASVMRSGWLASGPRVREFEQRFAEKTGATFAVATSSCTAALFCALRSMGIGPGDAVIVPSLTFTATAEAVLQNGAKVVFSDVGANCTMATAATIRSAIESHRAETGKDVSAVVITHYGGEIAGDIGAINELCRELGIVLINDCAHCLDSSFLSKTPVDEAWLPVGKLPGLCCFSFYPNKCITTGLGGMITGNDADIIAACRALVNHGISRSANRFNWDYEITSEGFNFNMPDTAAAMGIAQLLKSSALHYARSSASMRYDAAFLDHRYLRIVTGKLSTSRSSNHLYAVALDHPTISRDSLIGSLLERGIEASVHWRPLHRHKVYQQLIQNGRVFCDELINSDNLSSRILSLPLYPSLQTFEQDQVISAVNEILLAY